MIMPLLLTPITDTMTARREHTKEDRNDCVCTRSGCITGEVSTAPGHEKPVLHLAWVRDNLRYTEGLGVRDYLEEAGAVDRRRCVSRKAACGQSFEGMLVSAILTSKKRDQDRWRPCLPRKCPRRGR